MREPDEILYIRFLNQRQSEDLEVLMDRHRAGLTLFLYEIVGNLEDAEDLMLDAFASAAVRETWSTEGSSFKTWLFAVGKNLAGKHLRKKRLDSLPLEEGLPAETETPEISVLRKERNNVLYQAMNQLKPEYRQVLYLVFMENMSPEEVSTVMNKNIRQVYNLTARGKEALRKQLERMGVQDAQYN